MKKKRGIVTKGLLWGFDQGEFELELSRKGTD